jgi:ankyrin repeat protein
MLQYSRHSVVVVLITLSSFVPYSFAQDVGRALLRAAKRGDLPRVQYILKKSKRPRQVVNTYHAKTGLTPLHWAAHRNDNALARLLVRYGAQVNAQDYDGQTPLHAAAFDGCRSLVVYLLDHGAQDSVYDKNNKLPRDYAIQQGYREVAHTIQNYNTCKIQIPLYAKNPQVLGKILAQSIEYGFCSLVKILLDKPVRPTKRSLDLAYAKYTETRNPNHRRIYNSLVRAFKKAHFGQR